jgi:hypothetical protein
MAARAQEAGRKRAKLFRAGQPGTTSSRQLEGLRKRILLFRDEVSGSIDSPGKELGLDSSQPGVKTG